MSHHVSSSQGAFEELGTENTGRVLLNVEEWKRWGNGVSIDKLKRSQIREFLDWVYEDAVTRRLARKQGVIPKQDFSKYMPR